MGSNLCRANENIYRKGKYINRLVEWHVDKFYNDKILYLSENCFKRKLDSREQEFYYEIQKLKSEAWYNNGYYIVCIKNGMRMESECFAYMYQWK